MIASNQDTNDENLPIAPTAPPDPPPDPNLTSLDLDLSQAINTLQISLHKTTTDPDANEDSVETDYSLLIKVADGHPGTRSVPI